MASLHTRYDFHRFTIPLFFYGRRAVLILTNQVSSTSNIAYKTHNTCTFIICQSWIGLARRHFKNTSVVKTKQGETGIQSQTNMAKMH
jgi:hypothetical protein